MVVGYRRQPGISLRPGSTEKLRPRGDRSFFLPRKARCLAGVPGAGPDAALDAARQMVDLSRLGNPAFSNEPIATLQAARVHRNTVLMVQMP